ncbi:to family protein [Megaselia abdita]
MKRIILFLVLIIVACNCKDFPQDISQCKTGDVKCIANTITDILHTQFKGHNGLHLVSTDPLKINSLELPKNPASPVSVELKFKNIVLTGISQAVVKEVRGFDADPGKSVFEIYATIPSLTLAGPYSVNGKVLILPIVGEGKSVIKFGELSRPCILWRVMFSDIIIEIILYVFSRRHGCFD